MTTLVDTADATRDSSRTGREPRPGVVVAFSATTPLSLPLAFDDEELSLGRGGPAGSLLPDERLSRRHCTIARSPAGWIVRDLSSRNGTFVDGVPVHGEVVVASPRVIRAADTLLLPIDDVATVGRVELDGALVVGARLRLALADIDRAAASGDTLLLLGESGVGKELAARRFHVRGPNASGPFVAVNCATVPAALAERLLFGARRGAYSGATADAMGHVQAADGGVLFLDECNELDLQVQAKLLRVLEAREILPLGATRAVPVSVRVCTAAQGDLRGAVTDGRFRADLYHRISPPEVVVPPLRARLDEVPFHVASEIARTAPGLSPHARLVEACMLRPWPGNVRELRRQIRDAALRAASEGTDRVRIEHLSPLAGEPLDALRSDLPAEEPRRVRPYVQRARQLTREALEKVIAESDGNLARAARSLGLQRTQLYREMTRHKLERGTKS